MKPPRKKRLCKSSLARAIGSFEKNKMKKKKRPTKKDAFGNFFPSFLHLYFYTVLTFSPALFPNTKQFRALLAEKESGLTAHFLL